MINADTRQLIKYRMEQAEEALNDAESLFGKGSLRATMNRAYYAMFYSVLALLLTKDRGTSKHSGAITLFDNEFVKAGSFDKKYSKWLHEAFMLRQRSDYEEFVQIDREEARKAINQSKQFLSQVQKHIQSQIED